MARQRVRNAVVTAARVGDGTPLVTTTTDGDGNYTIQITGLPTGTPVVITVRGQGANGLIRLRACVRATSGVSGDVDETTTVGADAAEAVAAEGADDDEIIETAQDVENAQEAAEAADPSEVPDLQDSEQARERIRERARQRLVANLGDKMAAVLSGQPSRRQAMQAVMASQVYAHRVLGLPVAVRLSRAQVVAVIEQIQAGRQLTAAEVAALVAAAGVKSDATDADVTAALAALKARTVLATALADVTDAQIPMVCALLLAEQAGDTSVPFAITTREQMNGFVNALVGSEVAGPGQGGQQMGAGGQGGQQMGGNG